MGDYSKDFSLDELIVSRIAREFEGEAICAGATASSMVSVLLAKRTHAPELAPMLGSPAYFDAKAIPTLTVGEFLGFESMKARLSWIELFDAIFNHKFLICIGPAQVDQFGNANISVIGDWRKPSACLIGARGLPDDSVSVEKMVYHVANHSRRTFVEKVDFVCGVGFGKARDEAGLKFGEPAVVVSNLGVFDFDKRTGRMRIESIHPGISLPQVVDSTGFDLIVPDKVVETSPPSEEEVFLIRNELDPLGIRKLDYVAREHAGTLLAEIMEKERKLLAKMSWGTRPRAD
jgi:glutaconate CoA-transferase subunit B